jgi:hypothetical protein
MKSSQKRIHRRSGSWGRRKVNGSHLFASVIFITSIIVEFYNVFWSLQLPFSKPPIFANPNAFSEFKDSVDKIFPVIKEATARERAMMGSRSAPTTTSKRKREPELAGDRNSTEYFFAKFLTSPDLLDLEVIALIGFFQGRVSHNQHFRSPTHTFVVNSSFNFLSFSTTS